MIYGIDKVSARPAPGTVNMHMATLKMDYRWETAASVWLENAASGQFALAASDGLSAVDWRGEAGGRLADIAHLLGASLPLDCRCSPIYPEGFAFCPDCGKPLQRLAGLVNSQPDWWGPWSDAFLPRHLPHGLAVTSLPLGDALEERPAAPFVGRPEVTMPAPPNAVCVFAAAHYGFPAPRLLALAPGRNVLQYWDPLSRLWQVMTPEPGSAELGFSGAAYAWLPVANPRRGEVALVPTASGLCRLWINPLAESYRAELEFAGTLASAPGAIRRHLACLYTEQQTLRLWSVQHDGENTVLHDCADAPLSGWGRPIGYDGRLFWLHAEGQLIWQPGGAPQWLAWPEGFAARLEVGGATQSRDGRLWQIGHMAEQYAFIELGRALPEFAPIGGARLGFASFLFRRGHEVIDEPWAVENVADLQDDDSLVLPLLRGFNNNRSAASGLVLRFHKYTGRAEEALAGRTLARTTVEWIGRRNVILDDIVRLSRPLECTPIVYDDTMWLHHPDWPQMRGWRLQGLA